VDAVNPGVLVANHYTAGAAALFCGATLLLAAWYRQASCEFTLLPDVIRGRKDVIGCPILTPIDALEARHRQLEASDRSRSSQTTALILTRRSEPRTEGETLRCGETGTMTIFAFTRHSGVRVAEIGFALIAIAGALIAIAPVTRFDRPGTVAGGVSLVAGAIVVIVAIRWGSFGSFF
jgi:hypothetical protein